MAPAPTSDSSAALAGNRRLEDNPLFAEGGHDEFQVTARNVDFASSRFGLDADFVNLVKSELQNVRFSVVYHTDASGLKVDACRAAATAGSDSVFAVYQVKDPAFDPSRAYKNELMTPLGNGRFFGTVIVSKRLAVPDSADSTTKQYLAANGYDQKETVPVSDLDLDPGLKSYFGVPDGMGLQMYELQKKSFAEKFKIFYQLFKESPEYRAYRLGDVLDEIGSAMVLGVITPTLYQQGAAYGIAATITSIGNIGSPAVGILGESLLGSVVDNAVNSPRPLDSLKKVALATGSMRALKAGATLAMHPTVIGMLGSHPAAAFIGVYATTAILGAVSGVMNGKANLAIHDQIINKGTLSRTDYSKNFYQILGVESSISRALYLGSYSATVAAVAAAPGASLPMAAVGAAMWAASNFVWPLYHEKPEVKMTIDGTGFVHKGDRYVFDSGWEIEFRGNQGKIVQEDATHFTISLNDGELYVKNNRPQAVDLTHERHLEDYLPTFLKPKFLGEKETWELSNGDRPVSVSRYGNTGYHVDKLSDQEFLLTRNQAIEPFWQ